MNKYGASVFTTFVTVNGIPQRLEQHLERLQRHAVALGFICPAISLPPFETGTSEKIRITITDGAYTIEKSPFEPPPREVYGGVKIIVTNWQIHPQLGRYKTGNYLPYLLAKKEADKQGAFEALLVDQHGNIVDGTRTSPMLYEKGRLTILEGGLDGITREAVAAEARKMGVEILRGLAPWDNNATSQLLLAGSGVGLVPVGPAIDGIVSALIEHFQLVMTCLTARHQSRGQKVPVTDCAHNEPERRRSCRCSSSRHHR